MSNSKHRDIAAYVQGLLLAATPLAGGRVYLQREYALPTEVASQIHVNYVNAVPVSPQEITGAPLDWRTEIQILIKTRKSSSDEADKVADALWVDAYARVMADQTLGGLVGFMDPGPMTSDPDQADTSVERLEWRFTVQHRTSNNTLT